MSESALNLLKLKTVERRAPNITLESLVVLRMTLCPVIQFLNTHKQQNNLILTGCT